MACPSLRTSAPAPPFAQTCGESRRRRFLDHLLMAALQRAVALAEVDPAAVAVEEELHLDVARPIEAALEDESLIVEGRPGSPWRARQRLAHHAALPPP